MRTTLIFILCIAVVNTAIAAFLWGIGFGGTLAQNLLFSQCIGFGIAIFCRVAIRLIAPGRLQVIGAIIAIAVGALCGQLLARWITTPTQDWTHPVTFQSLLLGFVFGGIASIYFTLRERASRLENELRIGEQQRLETEKRRIEAQLKVLQAQIEPHFLFNTLANVAALIENDAKLASRLLDALICYLRASLGHTRADQGTLGDEVTLLAAYLEILKIRMGERLNYTFDIHPKLLALAFPPMLLQPLVENALVHGLEPKIEGGNVLIQAEASDGLLRLVVRDTGTGLTASPGDGMGLANVRARLQALFGSAARLTLSENTPCGVCAIIEIPT